MSTKHLHQIGKFVEKAQRLHNFPQELTILFFTGMMRKTDGRPCPYERRKKKADG
jgi:hypothetical protein